MKKEVKILFVCISLILIMAMPFASAGWFSDFWNKISGGSPITGYAGSVPSGPLENGICTGTVTSCEMLNEVVCGSQVGCTWDEGGGIPVFILTITGRAIVSSSCIGTASACSTFTGSISCGTQAGCTWGEGLGGGEILPAAACGDNNLDSGEECDDGNSVSGDGCSSSCDLETGSCIGSSSCKLNNNDRFSCEAGNCVWTYLECIDEDGDGYSPEGYGCGEVDCDDINNLDIGGGIGPVGLILPLTGLITLYDNNIVPASDIHPGATEICGNGIDEDCDGVDLSCATNCIDIDGDGYGSEGTQYCPNPELDCNDNEPSTNPGAIEICGNQIDENCNDLTDEFCTNYSIQSANYYYSENAYENSDMSVLCSVNLEGDYNVETPNLANLIPENCIQVFLEGITSNCNDVSTNIAIDGVYKTFSCNVGNVGSNKEILCAINSSVCSPGVNASSEISLIDVVSPVSCITNSEAGPLTLTTNKANIESTDYLSEGVVDLTFDIVNSLEANVLNLVQEISIYNLNTKEEVFIISQPSPVSTTESFNFSLNLPSAGIQDKFRMYLKVYNPTNEISACTLQKFNLNIISDIDFILEADIDFRNLTNKRITTSLGEVKTFTLDGASKHHLELSEILELSVIVTFSSDPFNVSLEEGVSQEVDLDGDGINDINITLVSIDGVNVDIDLGTLQEFEICSVGEILPCSNGIQTGTRFCSNNAWSTCQYNEVSGTGNQYDPGAGEDEGSNQNAPPTGGTKSLYLYILIGVIILLVLGVIIVLVKKKKHIKQGMVGPVPTLPMLPRKPPINPMVAKPMPPRLISKQPIKQIPVRPTNPSQRLRSSQPVPKRPMLQKPVRNMPPKQPRQGMLPKK